jgi:hypothetical protein
MDSLKDEVEAFKDLHVAQLKNVRENAKTEALQALLLRCGVFSQSEPAVAHNDAVGIALAEADAIADDTALLWLLERLQLPAQ